MAQGSTLSQPYGYDGAQQQVVIGTAPGAGLNFTYPQDGRYIERIISCVFTLTTSATVANRYVTLEYADGGGNSFAVDAAAAVVTAGSTQRFAGSMSRGTSSVAASTDVIFGLTPVFLYTGWTLKILVASIAAGDTLTKIAFLTDRFNTGNQDAPAGAVLRP